MRVSDRRQRHGSVSRFFSLGQGSPSAVAILDGGIKSVGREHRRRTVFWSTHKPLGFLLLVAAGLHLRWALGSLSRRPTSVSKLATRGHVALYACLISMPALRLLRQYGSGRTFEPFKLPRSEGFEGDEITWMVIPGDYLHGWLGWLFFAMVIGHIIMVRAHREHPQHEGDLPQMIGRQP